ncbi:hypothetical protein PUN28_018920 [Cardiocondyla obscurior]|uniref:Uncharacterized protein n=1 Tax=Cardiocondyla obscurior TaxID=286306 RepID=A0AAW2EGA5_9HYME
MPPAVSINSAYATRVFWTGWREATGLGELPERGYKTSETLCGWHERKQARRRGTNAKEEARFLRGESGSIRLPVFRIIDAGAAHKQVAFASISNTPSSNALHAQFTADAKRERRVARTQTDVCARQT